MDDDLGFSKPCENRTPNRAGPLDVASSAAAADDQGLSESSNTGEGELLQYAADCMPIGLVMFDANRRLVVANDAFQKLYGVRSNVARKGIHLRQLLESRFRDAGATSEEAQSHIEDVIKLVARGKPHSRVDILKDGRRISVAHRPLPNGGWVGTHEDITDRHRAQEQLRYMAHHDALTGLQNRNSFWNQLQEASKRHERRIGEFALHLIDLDCFKSVNDTYGHSAGDAVLKEVARRLQATVREVDTVARLGGDELAVIQNARSVKRRDAEELASRIITTVARDIELPENNVSIGASIGIAVINETSARGEELLSVADTALYTAKNDGRNCFRFHASA